jgi:hypothetical protein
MRLVREVARSLYFPTSLHALAKQVIDRMTEGNRLPYNGAHLRIEKDARDWSIIMGGEEVRPCGMCYFLLLEPTTCCSHLHNLEC